MNKNSLIERRAKAINDINETVRLEKGYKGITEWRYLKSDEIKQYIKDTCNRYDVNINYIYQIASSLNNKVEVKW